MQRVAFVLRIRPELKEEYKKAHNNIWPELKKNMQYAGIKNYSIYFKKDGTLFGYYEVKDIESTNYKIDIEIGKKWEEYMKRFFIVGDTSSLAIKKEMLEEVFHLD